MNGVSRNRSKYWQQRVILLLIVITAAAGVGLPSRALAEPPYPIILVHGLNGNPGTWDDLTEFWHMEPEMAFADLDDVMSVIERMLEFVVSRVLADHRALLEDVLERDMSKLETIRAPFARVHYDEALKLLAEPKRRRGQRAAAAPLKEFGNDPSSGKPVVLKSGRYGPYVTDGETNASLRKGDDQETLTEERAFDLIAERRAKLAK